MRILFVVPYIPSLVRVRSYNLIRSLAALGHRIHLVALQPPEDRSSPIEPLHAFCERIDVFPLTRVRTLLNAALALPARLPLQAAYSHHPQAERHVRALAATGGYDALHVEHLRGVVLAEQANGLPRVFDSVDSIAYLFDQTRRMAPRLSQRLMAAFDLGRTRHFEARAPFRYDHVVVTSPVDLQAIQHLAGGDSAQRMSILPNGVDLDYFRPNSARPDAATVLFSGKLSYHANVAAALYLGREIMPRVWQHRPDTRLLLVGKNPAPALLELGADPRVTLTGYVDDLRPYFAHATLAASPLRYGAGVQNKVLEAMASGVPVVATPRVVDSLQAEPERDLLVSEDAPQLARHVLSLIERPDRRRAIGSAGRRYVERCHDWLPIGARLSEIYRRAASDKSGA